MLLKLRNALLFTRSERGGGVLHEVVGVAALHDVLLRLERLRGATPAINIQSEEAECLINVN